MLKHYKQCLGLDTESLDTLANAHNTTREQILQQLYVTVWAKYFLIGHTAAFIVAEGGEEAAKVIAKEATKLVPGIGIIVGGCFGFATAAYQLHSLINNLEDAALFVLDYVTSQSKQH
ncbi:unnamed protein product [Rotaria sp. Silwood2]|nr:unnamed protein product [Rotaria sp. Silwood2]